MEKINIKKIKVKDNVRKDYGNLDDLIASIKEKGIIVPLLVQEKTNLLIAGHRRLKAAEKLKLKEVPVYFVEENSDIKETQLIENIQRKQMDPIEEGEAFKEYLDKNKKSSEYLSKKIGKSQSYIDRRISILSSGSDVVKALRSKKITAGHAFVLSRVEEKEQKKLIKEIIDEKLGVEELKDHLIYNSTKKLSNGLFNKKDCKECPYNGGSQTVLTEVGKGARGECLKPTFFSKKTHQWKKEFIEKNKKKGISVYTPSEIEGQNFLTIYNWDDQCKKIKKEIEKNPDKYAILLDDRYGEISINYLILKKEKPKDKKLSSKDQDNKLISKIMDFKRSHNLKICKDFVKPGEITKKLLLYNTLCNSWNSKVKEEIETDIKEDFFSDKFIKKFISLQSNKIDEYISKLSVELMKSQSHEVIEEFMENLGFKWSDYKPTKEYLKLFTIDQLMKVAKELKVNPATGSKKQIIEDLLTVVPKGYIPKFIE